MRQNYQVPAPLLLGLTEYLTHRPWREVVNFIAALDQIKNEQDRMPEEQQLPAGKQLPEGKQPS